VTEPGSFVCAVQYHQLGGWSPLILKRKPGYVAKRRVSVARRNLKGVRQKSRPKRKRTRGGLPHRRPAAKTGKSATEHPAHPTWGVACKRRMGVWGWWLWSAWTGSWWY